MAAEALQFMAAEVRTRGAVGVEVGEGGGSVWACTGAFRNTAIHSSTAIQGCGGENASETLTINPKLGSSKPLT